MKILIVEDEEMHTKFIKLMLKKVKNTELVSATNAFDAYSILKVIPEIDLLILDNGMPYVDGKTFYRFLRNDSRFPNVPIVFSSVDVIDVSAMSNAFFVKKPYSPDDLLQTVLRACNSTQRVPVAAS